MFYDDDRSDNREGLDGSAPKKRKRISSNERYEKVRVGGSSPDGQQEIKPHYDNDRNTEKDYNNEKSYNNSDLNMDRPRYSGDRRSSGGYSIRDNSGYVSRDRSNNSGDRDRSNNFSRERNYSSDRGERSFNPERKERSFDRGERNYNSDRGERNYNSDRGERSFNPDRGERSFNPNRGERSFNSDRGERNYNSDRGERNYNSDRGERSYNSDRGERGYNSDRGERNYNSDRSSENQDGENRSRFSREGQRDGFSKKTYGGSTSRSYGSSGQRGGFKKSYGKPDGRSSYNNRGGDRYQDSRSGFRKNPRQYDDGHIQPEYILNEEQSDAPVRLNKFIANTGLCSRREADERIQAGLITVNGKLITELGVKVLPTDEVCYNNNKLMPEKKVYILLNKPKDYVTSVDDPHAKRTIMELVSGSCKERIYPVGRLDRMTTGVIMLTNDGELTKKLTHPSSEIKKIYQITADKEVNPEHIEQIVEGITLDDGFIKVDNIGFIKEEDQRLIGIEIHSGRNRIVRRIFEHFGYKVIKLDRIFFAGLTKKGLSRGQWRFLGQKEVGFLKMLKV
jgi:23S rRNA pseudouridine2605 synthase